MRRTLFAIVLALALSGCSKGSGDGIASAGGNTAQASANPSQPAGTDEDRVRQFVSCLRDQGLDVPDPEPGDTTGKTALRELSADKPTLSAALEKCQQYLPTGGERRPLTPEEIEQQRVFAQCMRDNGFPQFPDPDPVDGRYHNLDIDKDDPAVRAVVDKCQPNSAGGGK